MSTSAIHGLPSPDGGDVPDVPSDMAALRDAIDVLLAIDASATPSSPGNGLIWRDSDTGVVQLFDGTSWQTVRSGLCWLATQAGAQTIPDSVLTDVTLDTMATDTLAIGLSSFGFLCPVDGPYRISGSVKYGVNPTGTRAGGFGINGSSFFPSQSQFDAATSGHSTYVPVNCLTVECNAGDLITLQAFQDSTSGVALHANGSCLNVELV